jgi:predicted RNA-binding protein with PUA-like domain
VNYWILQSNPKDFRITDWLRDFKPIWKTGVPDCWHINFFPDEVKTNDIVFIWKSKGNDDCAGIYAKGYVRPEPNKFQLADKETNYWKSEVAMKKMEQKKRRIAVEYVNFYLAKPLCKKTLDQKSELQGMTILRSPRHGIYKVELGQGEIISSLLSQQETTQQSNNAIAQMSK